MSSVLLDYALDAHTAGLAVIPPRQDGTKRPIGEWKTYQTDPPDEPTLRAWYEGNITGIGLICGRASGGLEMLEWEGRALDEYERFLDRAHQAGLADLVDRIQRGYCEETPSGGIHWLYRCPGHVEGNLKLARRPGADPNIIDVLIETRGEGGYVIVAPSHGSVHPDGGAWELIAGSFATIAEITTEERAQLHDVARTLDQMPTRVAQPPAPRSSKPGSDDERPGDYYDRTTTWLEVLQPHGWIPLYDHDGEAYWRRPGKTTGQSATTNYRDSDLLKVFTSSTPFDTETAYSRFAAHAVLDHHGDYKAAATAIAATMPDRLHPPAFDNNDPGPTPPNDYADPDDEPPFDLYADLDEPSSDAQGAVVHAVEQLPFVDRLRARLLDADQLDKLEPATWLIDSVLPQPGLCVLYGKPGANKTFVALDWALSVAAGSWWLKHEVVKGPVLYVAAEGVAGIPKRVTAWKVGRHTYQLPGIRWLPQPVNLLELSQAAALVTIAGELNPSLIIIDTLSRSMVGGDENSAQDMGRLIDQAEWLKRHTGASVLLIHHDTKAGGSPRGSSALLGAADTIIECIAEDGDRIRLRCEKQKDAEAFPDIWLARIPIGDSCILTNRPPGSTDALSPGAIDVLTALSEITSPGGAGVSSTAWKSSCIGVADRTYYRCLKGLVEQGHAAKTGEGNQTRYSITDQGEQALNDE